MSDKSTKPTHWRVANCTDREPQHAILLKETGKTYTYVFATPLGEDIFRFSSKTTIPKQRYPDMRFFTDELLAIDYLASLMIRESEAARQKMLSWEERLAELKQVRNECVAKAGAA